MIVGQNIPVGTDDNPGSGPSLTPRRLFGKQVAERSALARAGDRGAFVLFCNIEADDRRLDLLGNPYEGAR
jgi:hypothetical protein